MMSADLNVGLSQIKYISQHEYYANNTVNITPGSYDADNDYYYAPANEDVRMPLPLLLSTYASEDANDDYIISPSNPIYIDPKDTTGIDIPSMQGIPSNNG
jgi:hypothetical protein